MSDLIDRQEAIDALKELPTWWADEGGYYGGAQPPMEALLDPEDAISALENLPSAQTDRKKGTWIQKSKPMELNTVWWYECSECGDKPPRDKYGNPDYLSNYCPNCGADMRGKEDETD